jgi:hypothetical protein
MKLVKLIKNIFSADSFKKLYWCQVPHLMKFGFKSINPHQYRIDSPVFTPKYAIGIYAVPNEVIVELNTVLEMDLPIGLHEKNIVRCILSLIEMMEFSGSLKDFIAKAGAPQAVQFVKKG